jgi:hypothetical protein
MRKKFIYEIWQRVGKKDQDNNRNSQELFQRHCLLNHKELEFQSHREFIWPFSSTALFGRSHGETKI